MYYFVYIVTCLVKAQVAEPEKTSLLDIGSVNIFPPQPHHMTAVADIHETIEELLEVVFSTMRRLELSIGGECGDLLSWVKCERAEAVEHGS